MHEIQLTVQQEQQTYMYGQVAVRYVEQQYHMEIQGHVIHHHHQHVQVHVLVCQFHVMMERRPEQIIHTEVVLHSQQVVIQHHIH